MPGKLITTNYGEKGRRKGGEEGKTERKQGGEVLGKELELREVRRNFSKFPKDSNSSSRRRRCIFRQMASSPEWKMLPDDVFSTGAMWHAREFHLEEVIKYLRVRRSTGKARIPVSSCDRLVVTDGTKFTAWTLRVSRMIRRISCPPSLMSCSEAYFAYNCPHQYHTEIFKLLECPVCNSCYKFIKLFQDVFIDGTFLFEEIVTNWL